MSRELKREHDAKVQRIYRALADWPNLSIGRRTIFAGFLLDKHAELLIRHSSASAGSRADAFVFCTRGVFALLFAPTAPTMAVIDEVRRHAENVLADLHLDGNCFVPNTIRVAVILPSGVSAPAIRDRAIVVSDEAVIARVVRTGQPVLSPSVAAELARKAGQTVPGYSRIAVPQPQSFGGESGLFDASDIVAAEREQALKAPLQRWLSFLDPEQLALVQRHYRGPARISGPAGTGKSVVALHRMARIARESTGRLLFTTFVRSLPKYHATSFDRLAPEAANRAEFQGLHSWARKLLSSRGIPSRFAPHSALDMMSQAWSHMGAGRGPLAQIETDPHYWYDEVDRVIKAWGITEFDQYRDLRRTGRDGLLLRTPQRELVWEFYLEYQRRCQQAQVQDANDLISAALAAVRDRPLARPYRMVVVDEVQDVTVQGLRLAQAIAADEDNALLFVGDGQQQVYPGGWRLKDAGVDIRGRGEVLRVNYRNRSAILSYAKGIDARTIVDDLDGARGVLLHEASSVLDGGLVEEWTGADSELDDAVVAAIRALGCPSNHVAVITRSDQESNRFIGVLHRAGIATQALAEYDGSPVDAVKVGTVQRAKGLEFPAVLRPILDHDRSRRTSGAQRDADDLAARRKLVAVTRARDYAWLGVVR